MDILKAKYAKLQNRLAELTIDKRFALAFSGGIDSRFIAYVALQMGLRPLLIHASGPHISNEEAKFARDWALSHSADFRQIEVNPLNDSNVAANNRKRCYYCKHGLFSRLISEAQDLSLCDGTQSSDLHGYRPGITALRELGVISPLAEVDLSKKEIRQLALQNGMDYSEQKARPCLLTRFDYFLRPEVKQLNAIDRAESAIEEILRNWVNHHPDAVLPDFRLRQLGPDIIELHLTAVDKNSPDSLHSELQTELERVINKEITPSLSGIKIVKQLSGYFDRDEKAR